ncbi:histidine phosphatase family protein [Nisaea nitritireducens]|uniref:histidine phosphatase family protein n=1 Tax=Nisaea nitritireducens TaxID=568392 RepID=UPI001D023F2A|nr:histidine phosphatase family protein [Nisaea nitritireducens]
MTVFARRSLLFLLIVPLLATALIKPSLASDTRMGWEHLAAPRTFAIMRHAIAPGTGDPDEFRIGDCSTQRNLDERGRAQARRIGAAVRRAGVEVDRILSSQWCRCLETAELLGLGTTEELASLNSFFADRSTGAEQTEGLRAFLGALPDDERVVLVTHQVNITALTGVYPASGEVILFRIEDDGTATVLERIRTES